MSSVVVIGSGIAGLFCSIKIADSGHKVLILTKQRSKDSSTNWAQGGIAGILDKTNIQAIESHITDTLKSGDGECDEGVVRSIVEESGNRILDLINIGVNFDRDDSGKFNLTKEGGHSDSRILHAKDATGREIETSLLNRVYEHENIEIRDNTLVIDLIQKVHGNPGAGITGLWCMDSSGGEVETIPADYVIIATGGAGQLWSRTTNPSVATGDGMMMAKRAGCEVQDLAYVQFHPTASTLNSNRPFLISEALRGEGAVLLDFEGLKSIERSIEEGKWLDANDFSFMKDASELGSLATRDIVARTIDSNLKKSGRNEVYLYTKHLDSDYLTNRFPTIQSHLDNFGLKLGDNEIPVTPAAHYMVGGVSVDSKGAVKLENGEIMPGLFGIGEVARTGMHGANRLASNSLLEAVVYAHRAAEFIIANPIEGADQRDLPNWRADGLDELVEHSPIVNDREDLRKSMFREVGVSRSFARLKRAQRRVDLLNDEVDNLWKSSIPSRDLVELRNMAQLAKLVILDALERSENKGLHFNKDLI